MTTDLFFELVGTGRIDEVREALRLDPALVHAVGPHPFWGGRPQALHLAIEGKRRDMFDALLEAGANVNGINDGYDGWSPLMLAISKNQGDMRDALLARSAHVGILEALMLGDDEAVARAVTAGPLPAIRPNGGSILAFARTPRAIDLLLDAGASATDIDRWGAAPIEAFSRQGPTGHALLRHLEARGYAIGAAEWTRTGDLERLHTLAHADPAVVHDAAVFMAAVDFRHHTIVEWLVSRGASPNARTTAQSRHTALHSAAWNGDLEMVKLLVAAGADVLARDAQYDGTPEGWANTSVEVTNNPACAQVAAWLRAR